MSERSEQERLVLTESRVIQINEDVHDIKVQLDKVGEKIDELRKELTKRPAFGTWMSLILILFGLISGAYTYTWTEARKTKEDFRAIESRVKAAEDLSYGVIGRINTIDKKLIWIEKDK